MNAGLCQHCPVGQKGSLSTDYGERIERICQFIRSICSQHQLTEAEACICSLRALRVSVVHERHVVIIREPEMLRCRVPSGCSMTKSKVYLSFVVRPSSKSASLLK